MCWPVTAVRSRHLVALFFSCLKSRGKSTHHLSPKATPPGHAGGAAFTCKVHLRVPGRTGAGFRSRALLWRRRARKRAQNKDLLAERDFLFFIFFFGLEAVKQRAKHATAWRSIIVLNKEKKNLQQKHLLRIMFQVRVVPSAAKLFSFVLRSMGKWRCFGAAVPPVGH